MEQLIYFIINHWVLWLALVVVLALLVVEERKRNVKGVQKITPQQAVNLINRENAVVVDVREENSFQTGHLIDAINIVSTDFEENINKLNKHKTKPIILVCKMGTISIKTGVTLKKHGFAKLYFLNGGVAAWLKAGLPVVKS